MSIGVFVSYNHTDISIANTLRQCLLAISGDLNVFIDHAGLVAGDDYESTLARNIAASDWFLMICSGPPRPERDMGWCLLEAGQFRAKLIAEKQDKFIRSRLVSIHDDERPRQVSHFESIRIAQLDRLNRPLDLKQASDDMSGFEATDAFKLFENVISFSTESPLRNMGDVDVRSLLQEQARRLIRAFVEAQSGTRLPDVVLQPRISFLLPPLVNKEINSILTDSIKISGYESSLKDVFSIAGSETTWGDIKSRVREPNGSDPLWVSDIEEAAFQVAQNFVPEQPDGLCRSVSDAGFYRVLFARYEPYKSGAKTCYIVFIPTRTKQFDLRKGSSILLSSLILSIRFRQRLLTQIETIALARPSEKPSLLLKFERILHQIETEAEEFGLARPRSEEEEHPLLQFVRPGPNKDFMQINIEKWMNGRKVIAEAIAKIRNTNSESDRTLAAAAAEAVLRRELEEVQKVNGKFIEFTTEELLYTEKITDIEQPPAAKRSVPTSPST